MGYIDNEFNDLNIKFNTNHLHYERMRLPNSR